MDGHRNEQADRGDRPEAKGGERIRPPAAEVPPARVLQRAVHNALWCRFEGARRKAAERQTTLADYNFAKEKMEMDMDDITIAAKELNDVCDFRRKQVNPLHLAV